MSGGNYHVAAIRVVPRSSQAIAHGTSIMNLNNELTLVSLRADICLRLLMFSGTEYAHVEYSTEDTVYSSAN